MKICRNCSKKLNNEFLKCPDCKSRDLIFVSSKTCNLCKAENIIDAAVCYKCNTEFLNDKVSEKNYAAEKDYFVQDKYNAPAYDKYAQQPQSPMYEQPRETAFYEQPRERVSYELPREKSYDKVVYEKQRDISGNQDVIINADSDDIRIVSEAEAKFKDPDIRNLYIKLLKEKNHLLNNSGSGDKSHNYNEEEKPAAIKPLVGLTQNELGEKLSLDGVTITGNYVGYANNVYINTNSFESRTDKFFDQPHNESDAYIEAKAELYRKPPQSKLDKAEVVKVPVKQKQVSAKNGNGVKKSPITFAQVVLAIILLCCCAFMLISLWGSYSAASDEVKGVVPVLSALEKMNIPSPFKLTEKIKAFNDYGDAINGGKLMTYMMIPYLTMLFIGIIVFLFIVHLTFFGRKTTFRRGLAITLWLIVFFNLVLIWVLYAASGYKFEGFKVLGIHGALLVSFIAPVIIAIFYRPRKFYYAVE